MDDLERRLREHGHDGALRVLRDLGGEARAAFRASLEGLDLDWLASVWSETAGASAADADPLEELPLVDPDGAERARLAAVGEEMIRAGQVAILTVAGGEGTRLGFDAPKGCYPISPVRGASLYQLFAEGIAAQRTRYGVELPWVLMTSSATEAATREHLDGFMDWLGSGADAGYRTIIQGTNPVLTLDGKLLCSAPGELAVAPDGHGGVLAALERTGTLEDLEAAGVRVLFYHQVDNVFGCRPDPVQLGLHAERSAEMTSKVVRKTDPDEKVGVLCLRGGRTRVVEYSELPPERRVETRPDGSLRFDAANVAIHTFDLAFLRREAANPLPCHRARKAVACLDASGSMVQQVVPTEPNAIKLETFIFDLLPRAERSVALAVQRHGEFHPLKDATGEFSPEVVRRELSRWWGGWLVERGIELPAGVAVDGSSPIEVSPRLAQESRYLSPGTPLRIDDMGILLIDT